MLRKMTAVLLALLLALGCAAALAQEDEYLLYAHPHQGYTVEYPEQFAVLDADDALSLAENALNGSLANLNLDGDVLASMASQIEQMDAAIFIRTANGDNVSIAATDLGLDLDLSAEELVAFILPTAHAQYEIAFSGAEFIDDGSAVSCGPNEFARLALDYQLGGRRMTVDQYTLIAGGVVYTITFTFTGGIDEDVEIRMLSTFTLPE